MQMNALVDRIDEASHGLLAAHLEALGITVVPFSGGAEMAELVQRVKTDAVFLNWSTRYAGGTDPVRALRRSPSSRGAPLVMLTESTATSVVAEAARQGADFFLCKPLSDVQVTRTLARLLPIMREERRAYHRVSMAMPVLCSWGGAGRHTGESINVSASGMLLTLTPQPPVGARVLLAFGISELEQEFILRADVVRHDADTRVGLRYDWHSPELHETLKTQLEGIGGGAQPAA